MGGGVNWRRHLRRWLRLPTVRAVRGAIAVASDDAAEMRAAVHELIGEVVRRNALAPAEVVSALFTLTPDLAAIFPAVAARESGWDAVPMLCAQEVAVPGALPRCIRVLLHVERVWDERAAEHVYLREAAGLRPDLSGGHVTGREESPSATVRFPGSAR